MMVFRASETERLQRTERIFHEALGLPPERRDALIETRCAGDTALMAELRSLLAACAAEEILNARHTSREEAVHGAPARLRMIGPYCIEKLLGRGGMGAVYLAQRADGQFEQRVAIKLIDLPLATDLFRERFRMERQILAGLVHPYIARLLDGGVSEDGELYLAMEYVDGLAVTHYCERQNLGLVERLRLFGKICDAVQFAHRNLVVHRDLKPDNILVVADGTPRLLDFGTAKLLSPVGAEASAAGFTQQGIQAFTPQYASPEQVLGHAITTASDTYSLGVLLYVLLAGVPPYRLKDFSTAEMLQVICTEPPPRPSSVAVSRPFSIDHDLDAIVEKALRKEPRERYAGVDQLAGDIQAWLDGRPVLARRGTRRYLAGKFIRRHKVGLAAACVLSLSMLAGMAGVLWQSRVANRERGRAEARSQDLRQLSNSLLSEIDDAIKELPGSTPVQQLLVKRVLEHLDRMSQDAAGDPSTLLDLVGAYTQLGNLQGNPYDQNIGDATGALSSLDKALAIAHSLQTPTGKNSDLLGPLALAQQCRSEVLYGMGRTQESIAQLRDALKTFDAQAASPTVTAEQLAAASSAYGALGDQLGQSGANSLEDPEAAIAAYMHSRALVLRALAVDPHHLRSLRAIAINTMKVGSLLEETDPVRAIDQYHQSLAAWDKLPPAEQARPISQRIIANVNRKLGLALTNVRDDVSAIAAFEKARGIQQNYAQADPKDARAQYDLAIDLSSEAMTYVDVLDPRLHADRSTDLQARRQAIVLLKECRAIMSRLLLVDPSNKTWAIFHAHNGLVLGVLEHDVAFTTERLAELRTAASVADAPVNAMDLATAAMLLVEPVRLRDPAWTVTCAEKLNARVQRRKVEFLLTLAEAYRAAGNRTAAQATARDGLAMLPPTRLGEPPSRVRVLLTLQTK